MDWSFPLQTQFPKLIRIALLPTSSVATHWDCDTNAWSIVFQRLLKGEEIQEFQSLLLLSSRRMTELNDRWFWSLDASGHFSVNSLSAHLSPSSPMEKACYKALWKTSSPRRINILAWIMMIGFLNCSKIMQRQLPNKCLLPSVCPLCLKDNEDLLHFIHFLPLL